MFWIEFVSWYDTLLFWCCLFVIDNADYSVIRYDTLLLTYKEPLLRLFLFGWRGCRYDSRRLVMVTSSSEGTMMPLEMLLAIAWLRFFESVLLVT